MNTLANIALEKAFNKKLKRRFEDNYKLGQRLGFGHYAEVYVGTHVKTKEKVAVKRFPKTRGNQHIILREYKVHHMVGIHTNVVGVIDYFEAYKYHYIILEYVGGGELFNIIADAGHLSESQAAHVMREIFRGVQHIHSRDIVHRDLKPENILCVSTKWPLQVKLCDFGVSSLTKADGYTVDPTCIGTLEYVSPEVLLGLRYGKEVDIWACGVILYILLSGKMAIAGATQAQKKYNIKKACVEFPEKQWANVSETAKSLIRGLMQRDPRKRLTAGAALQHPFLANIQKLPTSPTGNALNGIHSRMHKFRRAVMAAVAIRRMESLAAYNLSSRNIAKTATM